MNTTEHLLCCLAEEASEISKDCMKALRFGLEDRNVLNPTGPTNRERIEEELNDLAAVINLCILAGILSPTWESAEKRTLKAQKVEKFQRYARATGALKD